MATEVSFLLTVIALLPRVLATSAVTFLCLWVGKHCFIFLQGFYMVRHLPHIYQYCDIFSSVGLLFPFLLKYRSNFYEIAPELFESLQTPLFAFISSKNVTIHINDAHLIREVCIGKRRSFPKAVHMYDTVRVFGENIVTTEGEVWRRHRFVARAAFSEANNRLVFETVQACAGEMMDAWERQREGGKEKGQNEGGNNEGFRVTLMEDMTQLTLAVISQASFGLQLEAAYGKEREEKEKAENEEGRGVKGGKDGRYTMSFTKCMQMVSHHTLAKVLVPRLLFSMPFLPRLQEIARAYREFDCHLLDSIDRERSRQAGMEGGTLMKEEGDGEVALDGCRRRWGGLSRMQSFRRRKDAGGRKGGPMKKEDHMACVRSPEQKEQERQHTQRRQQNLFSLLVQANDKADDTAGSGEVEEEGEGKKKRGTVDRLKLQELLGNAFIFLLAGHETSAHTLIWALLLLALHPDEQAVAHEEVIRVLGSPALPSDSSDPSSSPLPSMTYDQLSLLPYCQGVMNEALRLFPPVTMIPKVCAADTTLTLPPSSSSPSSSSSSFRIPKGVNVFLNLYALHRNPKHYAEPNAFKPRRWVKPEGKAEGEAKGKAEGKEGGEEEQFVGIDYFAFAPFSLGERSCLGRKFGQITVMASLALLLQRYEVGVGGGGREERRGRGGRSGRPGC
ncbi:cytochrome p450 [Nannochloropsis oceanica]